MIIDPKTSTLVMAYDIDVVQSGHLLCIVEDWSGCRSPARARRRRAQGHPQRARFKRVPDPNIYEIGGKLVMHPATYRKLCDQMDEKVNASLNNSIEKAFGFEPRVAGPVAQDGVLTLAKLDAVLKSLPPIPRDPFGVYSYRNLSLKD